MAHATGSRWRTLVLAHLLAATGFLAGCAGPVFFITKEEEWPAAQRQANVQGAVLVDEKYSGFGMGNHLRRHEAPASLLRYRRVLVTLHKGDDTPVMGKTGFGAALALVPDGMPLLKAGDLVELRHRRMFGAFKDFEQTGDGNAVLRLLCPSSPNRGDRDAFKACASNANWHKEWGESHRYYMGIVAVPSGRPYAAHLKDHKELAFTPYYDDEGNTLSGAVPMAPRPDIRHWRYPAD